MALPYMLKHKRFPSGLHGTGIQFTLRRANPKGVTPLQPRDRHQDRAPLDKKADVTFLAALWEHFGDEPFERGNLDAGRINWLFGREIVGASFDFDPQHYETMLKIDEAVARKNFPGIF